MGHRIIKIEETLNRDKPLDEVIFLLIIARNMLKDGERIIPLSRLKIVNNMIKNIIYKLEDCKNDT